MSHPVRRRFAGLASVLAVAAGLLAPSLFIPTAADAQGLFSQPKYAAIVEDASTGEVLYAMRADALRHPASLTKIMTLYLTFEALATGRLKMSDVITISAHANSMAPSKVSNHPGETLTVSEAIPTMTVHSANDVAVAMAERIGGSEPGFVSLMNARARELGMTETSFVNASGLPPDGEQISSARDMAILARATMRDYPQYYRFFNMKSYDFRGKVLMNHNHLVGRMPGVDGMKTGYTSLAGFNLVASGVRDGRRLIVAVLGGPSVAARDENVEELLDAGFTVMKDRSVGQRVRLASLISSPEDMAGPIERPPVEMGSGDQANLKVEVQSDLAPTPIAAVAAQMTAQPTVLQPAVVHSAVAPAASAGTSQVAAADCAQTGRRNRRRHVRLAGCDAAVAAAKAASTPAPAVRGRDMETAEATPCPTRRSRRRHLACAVVAKADAPQADAPQAAARKPAKASKLAKAAAASDDADKPGAKPVKTADASGYMIQVGAYRNHTLAQGQVDKIAALVSGHGAVEEAAGNYRARFRGLSQTQAKAACRTLSAKGQACMVMASS